MVYLYSSLSLNFMEFSCLKIGSCTSYFSGSILFIIEPWAFLKSWCQYRYRPVQALFKVICGQSQHCLLERTSKLQILITFFKVICGQSQHCLLERTSKLQILIVFCVRSFSFWRLMSLAYGHRFLPKRNTTPMRSQHLSF
jgi:hypothetical protein